jgi:hypothetical protein
LEIIKKNIYIYIIMITFLSKIIKSLFPFNLIGFESNYNANGILDLPNQKGEFSNFIKVYLSLLCNQLILVYLYLFFTVIAFTMYINCIFFNKNLYKDVRSLAMKIIFTKFFMNISFFISLVLLLSFLLVPRITTNPSTFFFMFISIIASSVGFSTGGQRLDKELEKIDPCLCQKSDSVFWALIILFLHIVTIFIILNRDNVKNFIFQNLNKEYIILLLIVFKTHVLSYFFSQIENLYVYMFFLITPIVLYLFSKIHRSIDSINLCRTNKPMKNTVLYHIIIFYMFFYIVLSNIFDTFYFLYNLSIKGSCKQQITDIYYNNNQ